MSMTREPKCVSSYGEWAKIGENLQYYKNFVKIHEKFRENNFHSWKWSSNLCQIVLFLNFITHYARPSKRHRQPHPSCLGWLTRFNCYQPKYCCVIKSHWYWFLVKIQKKLAMMSSSSASLRTWSWTTNLSKKLISKEDF